MLKSVYSGRGKSEAGEGDEILLDKRLSGEVWVKSAKQYIANCGVADKIHAQALSRDRLSDSHCNQQFEGVCWRLVTKYPGLKVSQ
jgi:hypothetical protein